VTDEDFLRQAFALARRAKAEGSGPPFGTVIVRDGKVIAEGYNRVNAENDPTWHGETAAIRAACQALGTTDLSGCTIYASSEPCPMCACAIHYARLDELVFGAAANEAGRWQGYQHKFTAEQAATPTLARSLPARQLLAEEGLSVFGG